MMIDKEQAFLKDWLKIFKIDKLKINSEKLVILINDFKNDKRKWQVQDEWWNSLMCLCFVFCVYFYCSRELEEVTIV